MLEPLFFALGLVNNLALIAIFIVRGRRLDLIERYGWVTLGPIAADDRCSPP